MAYRIMENCVGCQKCKVECPTGAIYLTKEILKVDEQKCVSCGLCSSICKESAVIDEEAPAEELTKIEEVRELECDVLVLGGGGAGMVAAARAADGTGLKVIVAEKEKKTGGGAWYAADFKMFNSKWQLDRGIPDKLEEDLLKAMDATYWKLNPELIRECYKATGKFFDWVCETGENVEDEFREGFYIFDGPDGPKVPVFKKMRHGKQGGTGKFMMDHMLMLCEKNGVNILAGTAAISMKKEGNKIVSVLLEDGAGKINVKCKNVVLATGSWIENQKLLEKADPKFAKMKKVRSAHRSTAYTGDGIKMAEEIGVPIDYESMCLRLMGPLFMPSDGTPYQTFGAMTFDPSVIHINLDGKRWFNEQYGGRAGFFSQAIPLREQKGGISYMIFDTNCIETAYKKSMSGEIPPSPFPVPQVVENWEDDMDAAIGEYGYALFKAASLDELADKMGIDAAKFKETITEYNEACQIGFDAKFCKDKSALIEINKAPYYALRCEMATDGAFGGIPIAPSLKVKSNEDNTFENLYAAGDITNGRYINQGGIKVQVINDLAWAFASGFMVAEHIKKNN